MNRRRALWLFLPAAAGTLVLSAARSLRFFLDLPVSEPQAPTPVNIPPRATLREVAKVLEDTGIVPSAWIFTTGARLLGLEQKLRYGEYSFKGPLSIRAILDTLVSGRVLHHPVTIPEGFTLRQIAARIEARGLGRAPDILAAARDPAVIQRAGASGDSLEGFLYPDTYHFPRDWPPERILRAMTDRFHEVVTPEMRRRAGERGFTLREVVTLASIIQKESGSAPEYSLISAVFHNRLRQGFPLMADPVIIYGIQDFNGNLTREDLRRPGPWNVYLNRGLPPGPICNPGLPALKGALEPAATDLLFFVSRNDGSHHFSRTLREHNRAVDRYQRGIN
jgi:UPF0755 protein